jgi:hypothetical protein
MIGKRNEFRLTLSRANRHHVSPSEPKYRSGSGERGSDLHRDHS